MRLVDQNQVALLHVVDPLVDRLDAGKQNARLDIALFQPGRIDAGRRLGPQLHQLQIVLLDQFPDVGDDQNALVGVGLEHTFDKAGHDQGFAARRRDDDERVARGSFKVAVDAVDGTGLIRA